MTVASLRSCSTNLVMYQIKDIVCATSPTHRHRRERAAEGKALGAGADHRVWLGSEIVSALLEAEGPNVTYASARLLAFSLVQP